VFNLFAPRRLYSTEYTEKQLAKQRLALDLNQRKLVGPLTAVH
jgi:hypothetical protein